MLSLIQKTFRKALSLDALFKRIDVLEKRVAEMENISDERESLWLFIEEIHQQEQDAYRLLQDELSDALVRNLKPRGEA